MALAPSLQIVRQVAEALAQRYLGDYTVVLESGQAERLRRKEVNDALWGTISLSPIEVALLDSPLLQRLRFLRQMGAAHWVYPGAVHTRFEHVLGALQQTDQLIKTVNSLAREADPERTSALIDDAEAQVLRLSTLFTHVGHLCFSDCAAEELELHPAFTTLAKDFSSGPVRLFPGDDPSFAQILAYYIVQATATRRFLSVLIKKCNPPLQFKNRNDDWTLEETIRQVSLTVIGRRLEDKRLQLHELVFGPFDANVLDELVRDAKFAGIPSVMDIRRLLQKLSVSKRQAKDLPDELAGSLSVNETDEVWLFGVRPSATSVLNELQLARVLITTKIRRHPKVLAVEQMLRSVIRAVADLVPPDKLLEFLYAHAEDAFVAVHEESLKRELDVPTKKLARGGRKERLRETASTLSSIRERRLWVRALQLSLQSVSVDPAEAANLDRLAKFRSRLGHVQDGPQLLAELQRETLVVLQATGEFRYSAVQVAAQVNARVLKSPAGEARVGRALILQDGRAPHALSESWGSRNWVQQYMFGQPEVYLFCPESIADAVFIAAERVLSRTDTLLPPGCIEASKRDVETLRTYKQKMDRGAWRGFPLSVRPEPKRLAQMGKTLRSLEVKLAKVSPEPSIGMDGASQKLSRTIHDWLQQFETDEHVECASVLIEGLEVLTRAETKNALHAFFTAHPEFNGASVIPFGNVKDGSFLQAYFAAGEKGQGVGRVTTLSDWTVAADGSSVVFVDDFTGSGSQAADILAAGFARQDLRKPELKEAREPFEEATCRQLLATKVAFLFVAAWDAGMATVDEVAKKIGLDAAVFAHRREGTIPFAEDVLLKAGFGKARVDAFLERCGAIGEELVRNEPRSEPLDEGVAKGRFLGYGNRAMLLSTLVNVPTQTLTLIWKSGEVEGNHWEALLPRRKKS